ncbi:hypothetical protein GCM10023219_19350 [Stakelama sediminis]|jgi:uncharacterized membrane protein|uniref:Putative membrane protein n=1 Tax=Stakelama sediminis TaxID=463200 RepID=A0A840Z2Q1_9SPHN|nr:hypothetical protein [Stakelama sediminis]MBB5720163.1 putative membrane protein [Stakelama sediminis]
MMIDDFTFARVLHVVSIVGWIGGVWFVTFVVMPAIARAEAPADRLHAFHKIEQGFSVQAKVWVLLAGASGFWMTWRGDMWWRFAESAYWWMSAMFFLWLVFFLMLFVAEPLFLHRRMANSKTPERDFHLMVQAHRILSVIALATTTGAMAGAHGLI